MSTWYAYFAMIAVGFLPNEVWRVLGLWLGAGLRENSQVLIWVRAVASATLAGVIAQMLLDPPGVLAGVPMAVRLGSVLAGFAVYFATRRSLFIGTVSAELCLVAGQYVFGA